MHRNQRPSDMIPISQPPTRKRHDRSKHIWWCTQQLTLRSRIAHSLFEDHGEEIRVRVPGKSGRHEIERPEVETPVFKVVQDAASVNLIFFCIAAVVIDAVDHELLFFWSEEFAGFGGEIYDYEPADSADEDCYGAFDYEDPWASVSA